jgi:hypothetical protein
VGSGSDAKFEPIRVGLEESYRGRLRVEETCGGIHDGLQETLLNASLELAGNGRPPPHRPEGGERGGQIVVDDHSAAAGDRGPVALSVVFLVDAAARDGGPVALSVVLVVDAAARDGGPVALSVVLVDASARDGSAMTLGVLVGTTARNGGAMALGVLVGGRPGCPMALGVLGIVLVRHYGEPLSLLVDRAHLTCERR